jgi:hypothetical protein
MITVKELEHMIVVVAYFDIQLQHIPGEMGQKIIKKKQSAWHYAS